MIRRRQFLGSLALGASPFWVLPSPLSARGRQEAEDAKRGTTAHRADVVIIGGGLGGCAAALAALEAGLRVVLTEETDWIGGQLTQQGVPPDENRWIESHGCTRRYRSLREGIRKYYREHFPLTAEAASRKELNPGDGAVSRLCVEPRVALKVVESMLVPYQSSGKLRILLEHRAIHADHDSDRFQSVTVRSLRSGREMTLEAPYFVDATELGDLLLLGKVEHRVGAESRKEFDELHAPEVADPRSQQAFTVCFAMDYQPGEDHRIGKPREYDFWRSYVPQMQPPWSGRLLNLTATHPQTLKERVLGFDPTQSGPAEPMNLWRYRRIVHRENFRPGFYAGDATLVNWPQNDYWLGNLIGVGEAEFRRHVDRAKQLSLSLLYWLQNEVPRPDGGQGWPGLRLRGDLLGTEDGFAKYPYIRESRRIQSVFTATELHCGRQARAQSTGVAESKVRAEDYPDTVGIGHYNIDLHPSSRGTNYIDVPSLPFQIPLGALLPVRVKNLLPACKNLGTTHITNGCYRLHPVEWNIGEAAGALVAFCLRKQWTPHSVRENRDRLSEFQRELVAQGVELRWPES